VCVCVCVCMCVHGMCVCVCVCLVLCAGCITASVVCSIMSMQYIVMCNNTLKLHPRQGLKSEISIFIKNSAISLADRNLCALMIGQMARLYAKLAASRSSLLEG